MFQKELIGVALAAGLVNSAAALDCSQKCDPNKPVIMYGDGTKKCMYFLPPDPACLRPAEPRKEPVVRTEPPSPRITNPTTLSELRVRLSDESRWVVDHVNRVLDQFPHNTAEKIRRALIHTISDHFIPNSNAQKIWNVKMKNKQDAENLFEGVRSDLRNRGELDRDSEQAIGQIFRNVVSNLKQ